MGAWLANNIGVLVTLGVIAAGVIAAWAVNNFRINALTEQNKLFAERLREAEQELHKHESNTALHLDPNRDKKIWEDFKAENTRRFDRVEEKLDRIMIHTPPTAT